MRIYLSNIHVESILMIIRFLLTSLLLSAATTAQADNQLQLAFDLTQGDNLLEKGIVFVSKEQHTWSKGRKSSYLKLSCQQPASGKIQKLYSTEDLFDGLRITHRLVENNIVLTVLHNIVLPRLNEIRALGKGECKNISPLVTTTSQTFRFTAKADHKASHPFGSSMVFKTRILQLIDDTP